MRGVYPYADYMTINISSPNTANLRSLQSDEQLQWLLQRLMERRAEMARDHGPKPIFVKIAPDLEEEQVKSIAATLQRHGIDGVIATNTTVSRHGVNHLPNGQETGGLSGAPLLGASNRIIRMLRTELGSTFPIIGVGGVLTGEDARTKIKAGANLVQIYTGLIYRGPALVTQVARALKSG
jgi:dihydroorotate dehydrogenase